MSTTSDRDDPDLRRYRSDGMQQKYLVLSEEERAKRFVRPLRTKYLHKPCGTVTTMVLPIAETYARDPRFYGGTFCAGCGDHFPVGETGLFTWVDGDSIDTGVKVGT